MKKTLLIAFVLVAISWQLVSADVESKTFIIAPQQENCHGPFPRKCLQVKDDPAEDWRFFYGYIDGFTYEPGYEYVLKVDAEDVPNPPIDGSSVKYTLKEQVSKTKA
ncbi:hypothetical protein HA402_013096 [Bradysia odoriphaga]|nr:hypothetical protein HA402_013096 [Bradysia odoriphaga]